MDDRVTPRGQRFPRSLATNQEWKSKFEVEEAAHTESRATLEDALAREELAKEEAQTDRDELQTKWETERSTNTQLRTDLETNQDSFSKLEATYDAAAMEIGFSSRYLLDIAQQIDGELAQFVFADAASSTIVREAGDESALYVLMPMRV